MYMHMHKSFKSHHASGPKDPSSQQTMHNNNDDTETPDSENMFTIIAQLIL
jgi:hypothetical protein